MRYPATPMPLNGAAPINKIRSALSTKGFTPNASAAGAIRQSLDRYATDNPQTDSVPDTTGNSTKWATGRQTESRAKAVDPSQGHGSSNRLRPADPLLEALSQLPRLRGW